MGVDRNEFVSFALKNHECCDSYVCTTCGGVSYFYRRLSEFIKNKDDLSLYLISLTLSDLKTLHDKKGMIVKALEYLDEQERPDILKAWEDTLIPDPDFTSILEQRLKTFQGVYASTRYAILSVLENRALADRDFREFLRVKMPDEVMEFPKYAAAYKEDEKNYIRIAKQRHLEMKEREDYLKSISNLPLDERIKQICSDTSLEPSYLEAELQRISDDDVVIMSRDAIQVLLNFLYNRKYRDRWSDLSRKLFDQRDKLRTEAMDNFRNSLQGISPENQLIRLISNEEIPVEHYPVELAKSATKEFINNLNPEDRDRFEKLLSNTPLRAWKKVIANIEKVDL
ncbi:MAG TPA: hypothetical protein PKH70_03835 [Syntrophorhabdaceae bacterium]|mgnify:CR=1 FL=1|nr:MAG: hypothetical protein BWX92_01019 [Deltaproteobacteria bacterium ADurb.Bin135]HNQ63084.1 hypothetical protein [Syntrophorhabdaceae bacterium]